MRRVEPDLTTAAWYTSSFSDLQGSCIEVGSTLGRVGVRDTKQPDRRTLLTFTDPAWTAFLAGVRRGEFGRSRRRD